MDFSPSHQPQSVYLRRNGLTYFQFRQPQPSLAAAVGASPRSVIDTFGRETTRSQDATVTKSLRRSIGRLLWRDATVETRF
jgi:hypothetical protein